MGLIFEYGCDTCEFGYSDSNSLFYFSRDLKDYNEDMILMMTAGDIGESPLTGSIDLAYCSDCNRFVKIYTVSKNETGLPDDEVERMILENALDEFEDWESFRDSIRNYKKEKDFEKMVVIGSERDSVICSGCGRQLDVIRENVTCPNCGVGKIMIFSEIFAD